MNEKLTETICKKCGNIFWGTTSLKFCNDCNPKILRILRCDNCDKDIGFISKAGRKFYDDGVWNTGFKYACSEGCFKNF